ncbi:hypothetical protein EVAR_48259_1 [Eumeta japonica]|uniref:Uncharacterized protein n=1 Tax=Eumeta variegata TaxID=151549 RepID=A0A4C1Y668_EUMVA|nr:hypothetical protein EVAR_48259_1 [Eumeta japonica]
MVPVTREGKRRPFQFSMTKGLVLLHKRSFNFAHRVRSIQLTVACDEGEKAAIRRTRQKKVLSDCTTVNDVYAKATTPNWESSTNHRAQAQIVNLLIHAPLRRPDHYTSNAPIDARRCVRSTKISRSSRFSSHCLRWTNETVEVKYLVYAEKLMIGCG